MKRILGCLLLIAAAAAAQSPQELFQQALAKERSEGRLPEAIQLYQRAAQAAGKDRALAAKALIQGAACYEKLGNTESRKLYERVVNEYSDQQQAVALAKVRLEGNAKLGSPTTTLIGSGPKAKYLGFFGGKVSQDGNHLSFTDWDTGDLAIYEIATGTHRHLTNANQKKGIFAENSVISRDGRLIAYNWYNENKAELRIANVTGAPNPRLLYHNPEIDWYVPSDWSPDGSWLAIHLYRIDKTQQIGLVNIADGSLRVLKSIDWRGTRGMFFSPDGKYLAYDLPEGDSGQKHDIFVLGIDGSRELPVVAHRADDVLMGWSPEGKRLLFASDRSGAMDLWGLPINDGKTQGPPELLREDIGRAAESKGVTRSGALFFMKKISANLPSLIRVAEYDSRSQKRVSEGVQITHEDGQMNRAPLWSPDGKYLAHVSLRVGPGPSRMPESAADTLVIRSADTYEVIRQWRGKLGYFYAYTLRWTRDGRSVLVRGADLKGRNGIFQIDIETGNVLLVLGDQTGAPRLGNLFGLSPDERKLYYSQGSTESKIFERDLISGQEKELMRGGPLQLGTASQDGRCLPVARRNANNSTTFIFLPLNGGDRREISIPARSAPACWTPDGQSLLVLQFAQSGETGPTFWRLPVDGGNYSKVEDSLVCRVHPDGRRVAYVVAENLPTKQEVWKLENFLPTASRTK